MLDDSLILRERSQFVVYQALPFVLLLFGHRQPFHYMILSDVGQLLWRILQKPLEAALYFFQYSFDSTSLTFYDSFYLKLCQLELTRSLLRVGIWKPRKNLLIYLVPIVVFLLGAHGLDIVMNLDNSFE